MSILKAMVVGAVKTEHALSGEMKMKMTNELIKNDLYVSNNHERSQANEKRITYEQIYLVLLTGFGLLVGSACLLFSYM